jgi:ABC-type nitrate/sulfonate/bicarbonate transport system substrate-binding protein
MRTIIVLALVLLANGARAETREVRLAVPAFSLSFSLLYLADDTGLWQRHGLDVKSTLIAGVGSANAVISGSADVGIASPPTVTRAAARGQKLLAIVAMQNRLFVETSLRKELAEAAGFDAKAPLEKRVQVLKGRTVSVDSINSIIHAYLRLLAHVGGFDPEMIRVAPMQPANMIAAFKAQQIDGITMSLPWPEEPVFDGKAVIVASGLKGDPANMVPFANTLVVVRPDTCESRKWICQGIGGALTDAASLVRDHPSDALALLTKRFPTVDPKLVAASFAAMKEVTPVPPAPLQTELANADTLNIEAGLMKEDERLPSYEGLFTEEYTK